jgi:hypothetical protein
MHDWIEVASDAFAVHLRSAEEGRVLVYVRARRLTGAKY